MAESPRSRRLTFGAVAERYERFRPGYPDEVADVVLAAAGRPVRTALEIGAGTGKATRLLAARGIAVTATDPDPAMLAVLRREVPSADAVEAALEDLAAGEMYDLVVAAASLHWTDPARRWPLVASLLARGGVFASFGAPMAPADPEVEAAVRAARSPFLPEDDVPSPDGTPPEAAMQWPGTELLACPSFGDVRQVVVPRRLVVRASDWVGYLSTVSAYLVLPEEVRAEVLSRVAGVLPDAVDVVADVVVHLARRE